MKAYRKDGNIVVEISESALAHGVKLIPESPEFIIEDREKFLDFCASQICEMGDSGDFSSCSDLTNLIDNLIEYAVESAAGITQG